MKRITFALAMCLIPAAAHAQFRLPVRAEVNGGVYMPDTFGFGAQDFGWTAGARVAFPFMARAELFAHLTYAAVDNFTRSGVGTDAVNIGLQQRVLVAGLDMPLGRALRFEIAVGGVSGRSTISSVEGDPDPSLYPDGNGGASDWSASPAGVPGLSYRFNRHIMLRVRDLIVLDDVTNRHNVSVTVGLGI
jgi:hypothetical protein